MIVTSSSLTKIEGLGVARQFDLVIGIGVGLIGYIITYSPTVNTG